MHLGNALRTVLAGAAAVLLASTAHVQGSDEAVAPGPATGDQQRHYRFEAANKEIPYRLYVPER